MARHEVAITVFCTVDDGVDYADAAHGASLAVRRALGGERGRLPNDIPLITRHGEEAVRVVGVLETGAALGNGYLWVSPTRRAWRDAGEDAKDGGS